MKWWVPLAVAGFLLATGGCATMQPADDFGPETDAQTSNTTLPDTENVVSGPETLGVEESSRTPQDVAAVMRTQMGAEIASIDDGVAKDEYAELPGAFSHPVVMSAERVYYYEGEERTSHFELIYLGVLALPGLEEVETDDIIGQATGDQVLLVARTTDLDPYLVASAGTRPVEYEDHWYYFPGPYVSSAMKWLSFQPADYSQFRAMFDHVTDPDELPGMAYFTWWVLLETALDAYPEPVQTSNGEVYQQLIYFQDLPLRLSYQDGFIGYLEEEYVPGEPIFLYLQIHSLSAFDKEFNCYVRDFSLIPPEQIVEERLATIMGER